MGKFIIDGTVVKVGSEIDWMWIAIESKNKEIVLLYYQGGEYVSGRRVYCGFSQNLWGTSVSTDVSTWYLQSDRFLKLDHHIPSPYEILSLREPHSTLRQV
jgi:hypothetical protein